MGECNKCIHLAEEITTKKHPSTCEDIEILSITVMTFDCCISAFGSLPQFALHSIFYPSTLQNDLSNNMGFLLMPFLAMLHSGAHEQCLIEAARLHNRRVIEGLRTRMVYPVQKKNVHAESML